MGRLDGETLLLEKGSLFVIDTKKEHDPETLQLSNLKTIEIFILIELDIHNWIQIIFESFAWPNPFLSSFFSDLKARKNA